MYLCFFLYTCVVEDKLNDVLNLVKSLVMLRPLSCVPLYPHSWSICEVALLDVLEPLETNVVEEQGTLTRTLAMVVKVVVGRLSLLRSGAMVTMQHGGLVTVSHNLSHHNQVQLVMAHLSEGRSEGLIVLHWKKHGAWCLSGSKVTAANPANKVCNQFTLCCLAPSSLLSPHTPLTELHLLGLLKLCL